MKRKVLKKRIVRRKKPLVRRNALKKRTKRGEKLFPEGGDWRNEFKKTYSSRKFRGKDLMELTAQEKALFGSAKRLEKYVDKDGFLILPKYIPMLEGAIAESKAILATKDAKWRRGNLPTLDQAKAVDPDIKGFVTYFRAVRSDLADTDEDSSTSLLGKKGRAYVLANLPGSAYIIKKVVRDEFKPSQKSTSTKKAASGYADLLDAFSDDFSADSYESESAPKSKSKPSSKSKSASKSKSKSRSVSRGTGASQSYELSSSGSGSIPDPFDFPVSEEEIMESVEKGEVVGVLDEDQILALRTTAGNFKDSLDTVQEALDDSKELYDNLKAQLSSMGLDVLPNPHGGRRVGSDRYFPGNYSPRLLSRLNPRGRTLKMKVPLKMKATSRRAAESLYVYPKTKKYPIGDLYHARLAIIYVLSPSNSRQRKKVIKAVQKHWPEYKWSDFWKSKSKGKGLKTWNQYLK